MALPSGIAGDPVREVFLALMNHIRVIQPDKCRLAAFVMVSTSANVLVESCLWELVGELTSAQFRRQHDLHALAQA